MVMKSYGFHIPACTDGQVQVRSQFHRLAKAQSFERRPDAVAITDDDGEHPLGVQVLFRGGGGGRLIDRQHARHEGAVVVVRKIVKRHLRGGARDLFGGLEVARIAARQCGASGVELLAGDRPGPADLLHLTQPPLESRRRSHSDWTLAWRTKGPGPRRVSKLVRAP